MLFPIFGYIFADEIAILINKTGSDMVDSAEINMYYLLIESFIIVFSLSLLCSLLSRVIALYTYDLRYHGIKSLLFSDQNFFDDPSNNPAMLSYALSNDCEKISAAGGPILGLLSLVLSAIICGIVLAALHDVPLTLLVIGLLPILMFSGAKGEMLQSNGLSSNDLQKTTEIASDSLTNIKTVHSYNRQGYFYQRYMTATVNENENVKKSSIGNGIMFGIRYMAIFYL